MRKIPTLYLRDENDRRYVTDQVTPGCEWVLAGEGVATRKYDGTCVMLDAHGRWWARREVKPGKTPPPGFVLAEHDGRTLKSVGWEPIEQSPFVKFHAEALDQIAQNFGAAGPDSLPSGTYELVGPKINGNPEGEPEHVLFSHQHAEELDLVEDGEGPWTLDEIRHMIRWCALHYWEGLVWHHPDGRAAKLKVKDFPPDAPGGPCARCGAPTPGILPHNPLMDVCPDCETALATTAADELGSEEGP